VSLLFAEQATFVALQAVTPARRQNVQRRAAQHIANEIGKLAEGQRNGRESHRNSNRGRVGTCSERFLAQRKSENAYRYGQQNKAGPENAAGQSKLRRGQLLQADRSFSYEQTHHIQSISVRF
jgi:hypothetical protein